MVAQSPGARIGAPLLQRIFEAETPPGREAATK